LFKYGQQMVHKSSKDFESFQFETVIS